jgi:hypothetical protein
MTVISLPSARGEEEIKEMGMGANFSPPVSFQKLADCDGNSTLLGSK